jgi:hypothetical protein
VDGAVGERLGERVIDQAVLVDERQAGEARADHGDVKVVSPTRAVDDLEAARIGKGLLEQVLEPFAHGSKIPRGALVDVKVHAEQDERPEDDRQHGR